MKLILLIALNQVLFVINNCYEYEKIQENEHFFKVFSKEASNLIETKSKRLQFHKKRLNNDDLKKQKKFKPIIYYGYSLDINIEHFKSIVMSQF